MIALVGKTVRLMTLSLEFLPYIREFHGASHFQRRIQIFVNMLPQEEF